MQQMLSDMTLMAKGDSVKVCWLTGLSLPVYRDFIHGTAQPTRNAWADMRYWYMSSLANGREWMEERSKKRILKSLIFVESSRFQVQKDSLKDYLNEKPTHTEIEYNKMYPAFGKSTDKEFEDWRKSINVFICSKEYECKDKIGVGCSFSLVFLGLVNRSTRCGTQTYRR